MIEQQEFAMYPESESRFFLTIVEAKIVFNRDDEGEVTSLTLHQSGQALTGRKVE